MNSVKPWLPYSQQLDTLKGRGLQVDDDEAALRYLARIGYYRLSGYWYPMRLINHEASEQEKRPIRSDQYVEGSRLEDAIRLYIFDAKLRLLALDALERIELAVRVDVAHLLGEYDPCAYKKPKYLHGHFSKKLIKTGRNVGKTEHQVWLDKYRQQLDRSRREPFVEHHQRMYGGELPIWAAIEVWDFGLLSKLFAGMKLTDQKIIANKYGVEDGKSFASWLRGLNFIRNVSAHHSRLWNVNVLERAPLPQNADYWGQLNNGRPFLYFCFMQQMLQVLCPNSSWSQRFAEVLSDFPSQNPSLALGDFGLVRGWEEWDIWKRR